MGGIDILQIIQISVAVMQISLAGCTQADMQRCTPTNVSVCRSQTNEETRGHVMSLPRFGLPHQTRRTLASFRLQIPYAFDVRWSKLDLINA